MTSRTTCGRALLGVAILLAAVCSYADSDGNFCTSEGYVAYEIRGDISPGVNGHVVKVVRFGPEHGIYAAGEVMLPDFQVHVMTCKKNRIEISGWGLISHPKMVTAFLQFTIEIADPKNVHVVEHVEDAARKFDPSREGPESQVLWDEHGPSALALESHDPAHKYQLVINHSAKPVDGGFDHFTKAELTQVDSQGKISQRFQFYENQRLETID